MHQIYKEININNIKMSKTIIIIKNYDDQIKNFDNIKRYVHLHIDNGSIIETNSSIQIPKYINKMIAELPFEYKNIKYNPDDYEINIGYINDKKEISEIVSSMYEINVILSDNIVIPFYKKYHKATIAITILLLAIIIKVYKTII